LDLREFGEFLLVVEFDFLVVAFALEAGEHELVVEALEFLGVEVPALPVGVDQVRDPAVAAVHLGHVQRQTALLLALGREELLLLDVARVGPEEDVAVLEVVVEHALDVVALLKVEVELAGHDVHAVRGLEFEVDDVLEQAHLLLDHAVLGRLGQLDQVLAQILVAFAGGVVEVLALEQETLVLALLEELVGVGLVFEHDQLALVIDHHVDGLARRERVGLLVLLVALAHLDPDAFLQFLVDLEQALEVEVVLVEGAHDDVELVLEVEERVLLPLHLVEPLVERVRVRNAGGLAVGAHRGLD